MKKRGAKTRLWLKVAKYEAVKAVRILVGR